MKVKDISVEDIIEAFKKYKTKTEICEHFKYKGSPTRFIDNICKKANINPNDYIAKVKRCKHINKICKQCGKEFECLESQNKQFCSLFCAAKYNNKIHHKDNEHIACKNCGKIISRKRIFCSNACQGEWRYKEYVRLWKSGVNNGCGKDGSISNYLKRYLLEKNNYKCEICGCDWKNPKSGNSILEIHHIDGNCYNNSEENLQVLCPNHHAMTDTYKNNNKNGRRKRSK